MKRVWRIVTVTALALFVALPLCFVGVLDGISLYEQRQAGKLLTAVRELQPGITSQAQYLSAVKPFPGHVLDTSQGQARDVWLQTEKFAEAVNDPACANRAIFRLCRLLEGRLLAFPTAFFVTPTFEHGQLIELSLEERQVHPIHCCSANVVRYAGKRNVDRFSLQPFHGYSLRQNRFGPNHEMWSQSVSLDQRATTAQVQKALDFKFGCFTRIRACDDATEFLRPAPAN